MFTLIGKLIKFVFKLAIFLAIFIVLLVWMARGCADGAASYVKDFETDYRNASKIVWVHQRVEDADVGDVCICAICMKDMNTTYGAEFTKRDQHLNSCTWAHENEYRAIYNAWKRVDRSTIESYGVNFK